MPKSKHTARVQRIIVDTNVLVSSLLGKSYPHKIVFDLIFAGKISLFASVAILEEYQGVLFRKKFQGKCGFRPAAENLIESVKDISIFINPKVPVRVLSDESDNKFLELALASQADFLITGNSKHFPLKQFENTKILSPKEYWDGYWK